MDFDQLFALRTFYEEEFEDETDIIKNIKISLIDNGMSNSDANKLLKEFYDSFGIPLKAEDLEEIKTMEQITTDLFQQMFRNLNQPNQNNNQPSENNQPGENNNQTGENNNQPSENNQTSENNSPNQNNVLNNLIRQILNPSTNNQTMNYVQSRHLQDSFGPCGNPNCPIHNNPNNNQEDEDVDDDDEENNNQNEINEQPLNSSIIFNTLMMNFAGNLLSELVNIPVQENVVCTLDETEKNKLEKVILENNLDKCCSVCMDELEKDNEVINLPCGHTFHSHCIEEWLSKYNYNCPVCKKEVGKPKYNI